MNVLNIAVRIAEETEFDPDQVTPGWEGFVFTALLAAGIIALGFLLVKRLRRNAYRAEVREQIAEELADRAEDPDGSTGAAGPAGPDGSTDPDRRV
ncbi:hypothetical protein [Leucobacter sp.]